ncbi:diaminobutyrate acetyltransferase [Dasania marina]|uniref:diaminobutyrate acetyltransferase n=1 Tax=Dasania marina TaxID=471499 RepID=UPI0003622864|nr:diaminobutyrate acetyltransferase [Dasania marina]
MFNKEMLDKERPESSAIELRMPSLADGVAVNSLVERCQPLDTNSTYCNLLQCGHFASTSVAAEKDGEIVGFVSGYLLPNRPNTLFIWQVAVSEEARGRGLGKKMLQHIVNRQRGSGVKYIETTITEDNDASWGLFKVFAKLVNADLQAVDWLDALEHFDGQHDSETLVKIGPLH